MSIFLLLSTFILALVVYRFFAVLWRTGKKPSVVAPLKTLVVLGSGGHTAEMLNFVAMLNPEKYYPRCYVAAVTDNMSLPKAQEAEQSKIQDLSMKKGARYIQIYRSREVGQSYLTSILTTLMAIIHGIWIVFQVRPDIILCNGPGTGLPICIAGFMLKILGIKWTVLVYIESIARVKKLSLTGFLLYKLHIMDQFYVQWPQLKQKFPRTHDVGRLM